MSQKRQVAHNLHEADRHDLFVEGMASSLTETKKQQTTNKNIKKLKISTKAEREGKELKHLFIYYYLSVF